VSQNAGEVCNQPVVTILTRGLRDVTGTLRPYADGAEWGPPWGPADLADLRHRLVSSTQTWDLVVVGAGITGAGVARDAAMRGLKVLVLDANDVAFGTSSRSTRLVHGGVRYLEQGEIGLVYEALRERARLYASAPHLVRPARFLFPAYRGDRLGPWRLRIGMSLYDALNAYRSEPHTFVPPEQCRIVEPLLAVDGLRGAVLYEDAITDDARLTLTVLQDARRHGAEVLTRASVEDVRTDGRIKLLTVEGGIVVRAREVVAATGPWSGRRLLGERGEGLLTLSKGIHIVMRAEHVPVRQPLVIQAPGQRRILFVVPWGTRTYLGTTDVPYTGDPGRCGVTQTEEQELIDVIARLLPGAALEPANIVSAWSGVRPLVRPEGARGSNTVEMSRRHRVVHGESGVVGLVGGKLTTFRSMAEEMVDLVVQRLLPDWPADRPRPTACSTAEGPLVPGDPLADHELRDPLVIDLAARHGVLARRLATIARARGSEARIVDDLPYRWCEVEHAIACEAAMTVADVLRRRLPLCLTDAALGGLAARRVAERLVDAKGGTASDVEDELDLFVEEVRTETRRVPTLSA
jgi:glycerol-3-phosphate dehydrogenase